MFLLSDTRTNLLALHYSAPFLSEICNYFKKKAPNFLIFQNNCIPLFHRAFSTMCVWGLTLVKGQLLNCPFFFYNAYIQLLTFFDLLRVREIMVHEDFRVKQIFSETRYFSCNFSYTEQDKDCISDCSKLTSNTT